MEALLAGKPRSVAIGALRALVVPLREHWGDLEAFRNAGLDVLAREGGGVIYDEQHSPAHLEQVYRQTIRARATYFRSVENVAQLDHLFKELDLTAAKATSPMQQGVLWLASRLQQQVISILQNRATDGRIAKVLAAVDEGRAALTRSLGDPEQLTLDRIEAALTAFAQEVLGGTMERFEQTAIAGHLLEKLREAARRLGDGAQDLPENEPITPLVSALGDAVWRAELNDARQRYARLGDEEKTRRFNEFRRSLLRIVGEVAPIAPDGFEDFCKAIEVRLYPYPEPVQFIRTFARPMWTNGSQSNVFSNTNTPQSVQSMYDTLIKARQGNPVVLEIARAFALRNFRAASGQSRGEVLTDTDLKAEFGWPDSLGELRAGLKAAN